MLCQTQIGMKKKPEINTYTIPSSNVSCTQSTTFLSESVYKNIGYIGVLIRLSKNTATASMWSVN